MWEPVDLLGEWQVGMLVSVIAGSDICLPDIVPFVNDIMALADTFEVIDRLLEASCTSAWYLRCRFKQRDIEIVILD